MHRHRTLTEHTRITTANESHYPLIIGVLRKEDIAIHYSKTFYCIAIMFPDQAVRAQKRWLSRGLVARPEKLSENVDHSTRCSP